MLNSGQLQNLLIYSPKDIKIENAWGLPNQVWAKKIYDEDVKVLSECDTVICIYNGFNFTGGTGATWEPECSKFLAWNRLQVLTLNPSSL